MMQMQPPPAPPNPVGPTSRPFKRPACNSCRVAHVACEKCSLLGKGEQCRDANVKKRGRPRKSATGASSPGAPKAGLNNAAVAVGPSSSTPPKPTSAADESGSAAAAPPAKRARTNQEIKPALPAVLPRPTSTTTTPTASVASTSSSSSGAATSDSVSGHHSPPPLGAPAPPSDLPRLPPPSSLLRLGQQGEYSTLTAPATLPPLPPLSTTTTTTSGALLYPSFIISLFQNAAGITPIAQTTSQAVPTASVPPKTASPSVPPSGDTRGGLTEANLIMILDSIKEIRETNEQLRKEMTEIKNENAQLKKEKEELRTKLEEHLAQDTQQQLLQQQQRQQQEHPQ